MKVLHKIVKLQKNCSHTSKYNWTEEYWAPGHLALRKVTICKQCGKITDNRPITEMVKLDKKITEMSGMINKK